MAVFRIERTRDYTVMSNHHLRNANLSLKAKGLLSMMLSLPEDWNPQHHPVVNANQICTPQGVDAAGAGATAQTVTRKHREKGFCHETTSCLH